MLCFLFLNSTHTVEVESFYKPISCLLDGGSPRAVLHSILSLSLSIQDGMLLLVYITLESLVGLLCMTQRFTPSSTDLSWIILSLWLVSAEMVECVHESHT